MNSSINKLNDLALFLGMFAGDGSLPRKHNGEGYRNYVVAFYNTKEEYVKLFNKLFLELTGIEGKIKKRIRENRQPIWQIEKYSKKAFDMVNKEWEIPEGKKARNVFVPSFIMSSNEEVKKTFSSRIAYHRWRD